MSKDKVKKESKTPQQLFRNILKKIDTLVSKIYVLPEKHKNPDEVSYSGSELQKHVLDLIDYLADADSVAKDIVNVRRRLERYEEIVPKLLKEKADAEWRLEQHKKKTKAASESNNRLERAQRVIHYWKVYERAILEATSHTDTVVKQARKDLDQAFASYESII